MAARRRTQEAERKKLQGEAYYAMLQHIHTWSEKRRMPFRGVMLEILREGAKRRRIKLPPAPLAGMEAAED